MVLKIILSFIGVIILDNTSFAQSECACCTPSHRQFDFWIGEWLVYDTLGNRIGRSSIKLLEDHCLVSEHWKGDSGVTGRSFNYFNVMDSTWNQIWIDNQGNHLVLKGKGREGEMVLYGQGPLNNSGPSQKHRITWTALSNGKVSQIWEILDENGNVKKMIFKGLYQGK
ncbi:hypothetical protein QWY93_07190 [Echinicola jeungdonensis]|uniref:DUF1579 domain-containing protein n=1 Tax=Echinicola jeungdonensis TaxID=709343 RepID=A0ABV5J9Y3_9BACT|nr:hypothetical protein [Echinicola jeungdonensis]MDN3669108.1 hypothetical protein [Echinicola jeungdonensis]